MTLTERERELAGQTSAGTFWAFVSKYAGKGLNFITVMILTRLLVEQDFGVAGYALVVIAFFEVVGLGVGPALVYHGSEDRDRDTAFWMAIGVGLFLFVAAQLAAPAVGAYFGDPRAVSVTRVLAFSFLLIALEAVPEAILLAELRFREAFLPRVAMAVAKGGVGIGLALAGFGPWALILAQLAGATVQVIAFWLVLGGRWRPSFRFDRGPAGRLATYAWSIVNVHFLGTFLINVDYLLVGRYLGAASLGLYTVAFRVPELLIKEFYGLLSRVLFPILTSVRDDQALLRRAFVRTIRYVATLTVPMGVGLALVAEPFVTVAFGSRWQAAAAVVVPIALYTVIRSLYFSAGTIYKSVGRPQLLTRLHLATAVVVTPALYLAITRWGTIEAVAWTQVAMAALTAVAHLGVAGVVLQTRVTDVVGAVAPPVLSVLPMAAAVWAALRWLEAGPWVELGVGVSLGVVVYGLTVAAFQRPLVLELRSVVLANRRAT